MISRRLDATTHTHTPPSSRQTLTCSLCGGRHSQCHRCDDAIVFIVRLNSVTSHFGFSLLRLFRPFHSLGVWCACVCTLHVWKNYLRLCRAPFASCSFDWSQTNMKNKWKGCCDVLPPPSRNIHTIPLIHTCSRETVLCSDFGQCYSSHTYYYCYHFMCISEFSGVL